MQGLEAINAVNGWSMALLGASIVFTGLVVLSLAISQLEKVVKFIESRQGLLTQDQDQPQVKALQKGVAAPPDHFPEDMDQAVHLYNPLFEKLGDTFQLSELYKLTKENNFPHPHLTIKLFRQAQILVPVGDGSFTVNQ